MSTSLVCLLLFVLIVCVVLLGMTEEKPKE